MSAADEAARLRALADLIDSEAELEDELAEAKAEYRSNLDDEGAKQRLHDAKQAIVEARKARRGDGVTIGGDAVKTEEN